MKLEGIKVVDLSWFLPGPYLTTALADHGATVINLSLGTSADDSYLRSQIDYAIARGVAVVATETGGPEEVIEHGRNGLLVPAADPDALADAVHRVVTDPEFRRSLAGAGSPQSVPTPAEQVQASPPEPGVSSTDAGSPPPSTVPTTR